MNQQIKIRPLWMVHEEAGGTERLYMQDGVYPYTRPAKKEEETLDAMAGMLDLHAEECNAHEFVCVHRGLAVILAQELGIETARRVMRRIVNYAGLHGMMGWGLISDKQLPELELGVSPPRLVALEDR